MDKSMKMFSSYRVQVHPNDNYQGSEMMVMIDVNVVQQNIIRRI